MGGRTVLNCMEATDTANAWENKERNHAEIDKIDSETVTMKFFRVCFL